MIRGIALTVLIVFALFGVFVFTTAVHELSHKMDFEEVEPFNEEICILNLDTNLITGAAGYYSFEVYQDFIERSVEIRKYTEFKAYAFDLIIALIFLLCVAFVLEGELKYLRLKLKNG